MLRHFCVVMYFKTFRTKNYFNSFEQKLAKKEDQNRISRPRRHFIFAALIRRLSKANTQEIFGDSSKVSEPIRPGRDQQITSYPYSDSVIETKIYSGIILPSPEWHTISHPGSTAKITFRIRVICDPHYYNTTCQKFCRPRDNIFGHYTCDSNGDKVCLKGWMGPTCEKGKSSTNSYLGEYLVYLKTTSCTLQPWLHQLFVLLDVIMNTVTARNQENANLNYCGTHEPCLNRGTCENTEPNDFKCRCPDGFSGVNCQIVDNMCLTRPCQNDGVCSEVNGGYKCTCRPGYTGEQCQINIDECASRPCKNGGICADLVNSYKCKCPEDANECAGSPCVNAISCRNLVGDYVCQCQPGWRGKNCDQNINDCVGQCLHGATCIDLVNDFHCACLPGFSGRHCEHNIDECANNPCRNGGQCVDFINSYKCICTVGYIGPQCEIDDDLCSPNPCRNGATCFNTNNDYYCQCTEEYEGKSCASQRPSCRNPPCHVVDSCTVQVPANTLSGSRLVTSNICGVNGRCITHGNGNFTCACNRGYTGRYCHENVNDCLPNRCNNGGTCIDGVGSFQCICQDGWEGKFCNMNKNECNPNPCRNNAICSDKIADFVCNCKDGWKGKLCNLRHTHCDINTCMHGGTCIDVGHGFRCHCPDGWGGSTCQISKNPSCKSNPCKNSATCINTGDTFTCMCREGFEGTACEYNINDCNPYPCYNGGKCMDGINRHTCQCSNGFTGPDCRINVDECASSPCSYGSTCVDGIGTFLCICPPGRIGPRCKDLIPKESPHLPPSYTSCQSGTSVSSVYYVDNKWNDICQSCTCLNGHLSCTNIWCNQGNCLIGDTGSYNTQSSHSACSSDKRCFKISKEVCLRPPCFPRGECRPKENYTAKLEHSLSMCSPRKAEVSGTCAKITLMFDKTFLPQGVTVGGLCDHLRWLPIIKDQVFHKILIACELKPRTTNTVEVTVSAIAEDLNNPLVGKTAKAVGDLISNKNTNSSAFAAVIEVKVETAVYNPHHPSTEGKNTTTVTIISVLLSVIIIIIIAMIAIILYMKHRRRKPPNDLQLRKKLQNEDALDKYSVEEKSNNQNEENLRRYHNPLNISASSSKEIGCSIKSSDSTEMLELEIESREDLQKNIYKAQPPGMNKNIVSSLNENNKDIAKKNNALKFGASGSSYSQSTTSTSKTLDMTKNPVNV
ncbi:Protein jagged-1 [Nymphon striatum]|nr:Protein jagged-1 [Nymphon striatum]